MTITAVIKFGGASITHKSSGTFDLNYPVIESSVLQIAAARKIIGQGLQVLLVCGVGPFGHVNVVRHNIANGVFSANQKVGVAITKEACDAVGFAVTNAAVSAGLQAVYVPAHTIARKRGGKAFDKFDHDVFRQLMNEGSMPVTTGTMVEDCEIGFAVLSGDEIVAQLSELLDPERILLGSDVDGIFTADPSVNPNARLISAIDTSNLKLVLQESVTGSKAVDVTGGMRGKLEQLSHSIGKRVAFVFRLGAAEFALNTLGKRTKPNTAELPSMVQFGVFQLRQLPATISAGSVLQCWVEMYILAVKGVKAEDDLTIELVCVASCKTSNNIEAVEEVWPKGRVSRVLAPYKENGQIKVFGQGNHSYIVQFEVPEDCFPSVENARASQNGVNAEFDISYVIRCTFPSRDNSFSLDQPVTVVQPPLPSLMLSPLDVRDRSPLGIAVSLRANRQQWHAEAPATLFYSFKAPYKSDVPTVLIEIIQKLSLPNFSYKLSASQDRPAEATAGVPFESVVATFPMPSVPANSVSNYTVTLSPIPYMAPSMYLGPIDVDYAIRIVAVFPPTVAGANQLVEVLATTNINLLPKSQELEIDLQFDTVDKTLPTDGTANSVPIIEVAPWSPLVNPQFNQPPVSLPGPLAFQSAPLAQFPVHPQSGNFPASPPQFHAPLSTPLNAPAQSVSVLPQQVALPPTANVLVPKFSHSQSLHDQEHDSRVVSQHHPPGSIEARLKKMEAQRDVLPVDSTPLPVYSEAAPPFQPLPQIAYANQSNLPPVSEAVTSVVSAIITPDHQRMKMQQEELERIKFEREKLAAEAEQLREQERLRHQALLEEARRRKEEALEAERAKAEEKKRMEIERVMEENRRLEAEKLALEEAERLRAEQERKRIEEEERRKAEEEARRIESERKKAEELERLRLEAEAKRIEEERLKAEEIKRVEDEKRRAEDERIEALRQKTNEARRQLELGKQELEEQERLRELESQLEELRLQKQIQAEKSAAAKALEDQRRQTEVDKLKRDAELQAEKLKLQAELEFTKERAENDRLREEVERLKAQQQKHQSVQYGNIGSSSSHPVSRSQEKMNPLEFGDDEDVEPLQQRRQGGQFYKTVGLVREKTKHAAVAGAVVSSASSSGRLEQQSRVAPTGSDFSVPLAAPVKPQGSSASSYTPATSSPTEAQMKIAYDAALDSYRNRLFTHVGISGRPLTGREQTVARNDELMSAAKHLGGGSKSTAMMSALEAEMRVIESEILEDYENGLFLQMKEKILNCKETLRAMFDAGLINSTKELNEECKTALEGIKIDGDVSGRAYERAKATFEETVKAPLTKLMAQRELGNNGANAGFSSHKCSRRDCSNPKAVGRDFCSRNCETLAARGMIRQAYYESIKQATTNWLGEYLRITGASSGDDPSHDLPYDSILHVIIIPNYCETTDTLCETLDVLASHRRALTQYRVCLAMEESEKGCVTKAQMLLKVYSDSFFDITYTVHPANLPGEIRGKSSNVAWAAREMAKYRTVPANIAAVAVEKMYHERIHGVNCGYESVDLSNDLPGQHSHEVITVLDCDSIFAEDYFAALACHYATASPEQRKIMMFMPSTVFDRNSNQVPIFVRTCDIYWSLGVMSSMYNNSPIKFPCSAYSISMDLCISVNFWDTGPESIGEDMHMFLKCFFSTGGKVIIKSIYSAVSCCNIETSHNSLSEPMRFICGLLVRYEQAKRHLWGSLDTGYAIKRAILFFFAPDADNQPSVHLKHANVSKLGKDYVELNGEMSAVEARRFLCLFHRVLETHCLMGHFAIVGLVRTIMNTLGSNIQKSPSIGIFYGVPLSFEKFSAAIIFCCVVCNFMSASFYEKYYKFVGFERWALQTLSSKHSQPHKRHHRHHKQNSQNQARAQAAVLPLASTKQAIYGKFGIDNTPATVANNRLVGLATMAKHGMKFHPDHEQLQVLPLGRRPQLSSPRGVLNLIEWCLIPYAALFYFVLPQCHAQLAHLITNKLDYRVSGKPELKTSSLATLTMEQVVMSAKGLEQEQHQHSKQNQQQNHLDRKQESHQLSPPQKLGFLSEENVPYAQVVIDMGTGGSDTDSKSVTVASEESRGDEGYFEEDF